MLTSRLHPDPEGIAEAARILRAGGLVAFPTETVYGLGANALDPAAVAKIFAAKQRPDWDPLIVHIADLDALPAIAGPLPEPARRWAERFWPGPLTLLLPRTPAIPDAVTAGRARVGVRIPRHPAAQALLRAAGIPVAAPSANLFGHVSPTTAAHVLADLDGRIDAVLDAGPCEHGLESTVVDACPENEQDPCILYRPGAVTLEQLQTVWPRVLVHQPATTQEEPASLPSPGVGLRHYAPRAALLLFENREDLLNALQAVEPGTGLLLPANFFDPPAIPPYVHVQPWAAWGDPAQLAHALFAALRALDDAGVLRILCPLPPATGIGAALRDRLEKAAKPR